MMSSIRSLSGRAWRRMIFVGDSVGSTKDSNTSTHASRGLMERILPRNSPPLPVSVTNSPGRAWRKVKPSSPLPVIRIFWPSLGHVSISMHPVEFEFLNESPFHFFFLLGGFSSAASNSFIPEASSFNRLSTKKFTVPSSKLPSSPLSPAFTPVKTSIP